MRKTRMNGVSADAILLTFVKLVTAVLSLVITRLLAEYLTIYDYGTYSQITLLATTISSITMFGMMDGVNFFYVGELNEERRESYIATIFALQCVLSTVAGIFVVALNKPICRYFENSDVGPLLVFAVFLPFLQNLLGILRVLFVAVGKARLLAYRNLIVSLVRLLLVSVVVFFVRSVALMLIITIILDVGQIVFFGVVLLKCNTRIKLKRVDWKLLRPIIYYCAPMAIYTAVSSINRDMDKYLISTVTDTETLAMYANASKQLPFDIIMISFCTLLVPYITKNIAEKSNEKAVQLYKLFLEITYISTGILCCAALSVAPQLMKLLYSNKYIDGLAIFCVYILVDFFRFTNITLVLSAAGKTRVLMIMGVGAMVFNVGANALLYNTVGLIGPAVATLATTVLLGLLLLSFGAKVLNARFVALFDLKYMVLFLAENAFLTLGLSKMQQYLSKANIHYFLILFIVAGLYGGIMLLLNGKRLLFDMKNINALSKKQ